MIRLVEIGLFLAPFALFLAWRFAGSRSPLLVWGLVAVVVAVMAGTVWFGLSRRLPAGTAYVPAQLEDGRIVPGHGAERAAR